MKITILTGPFMCLPPNSIGAVEKLWYSIGNAWRAENNDVVFVSKKPTSDYNDKHVYIKGYDRTGSWLKDFVLDFFYSVRALSKAPISDVVILNSLWSPILIRLYKKKFKLSMYSVERFPKKQISLYRRFGKVDCFRCCSRAVYDEVIKQNKSLKNFTYLIPNFIDTDTFSAKKAKICSDKPTIIYTGRVHEEKGLDYLVKAAELLYKRIEVSVIIIGSRDKSRGGSGEEYVRKLEKLAPHCKITWVDAIYNPHELASMMLNGDIFCYPSVAEFGETFGVAPLEAMGLGIPVVVSSLACFRDFVTNGENGYVFNYKASNAIEILADKLYSLISSKELYKQFSEAGIKTAQKYNVNALAKQYINLFEELLNG